MYMYMYNMYMLYMYMYMYNMYMLYMYMYMSCEKCVVSVTCCTCTCHMSCLM